MCQTIIINQKNKKTDLRAVMLSGPDHRKIFHDQPRWAVNTKMLLICFESQVCKSEVGFGKSYVGNCIQYELNVLCV